MKHNWPCNFKDVLALYLPFIAMILFAVLLLTPTESNANLPNYEEQRIHLLEEQNRILTRIANSLESIDRKMK